MITNHHGKDAESAQPILQDVAQVLTQQPSYGTRQENLACTKNPLCISIPLRTTDTAHWKSKLFCHHMNKHRNNFGVKMRS